MVWFCLYRSSRSAEREAHRGPTGERRALAGAPSEDEPPRLAPPIRQGAPEDDGPEAAGGRPRPPDRAAQRERGQHVLTSTSAGDHEGPVLGEV